MSNNESFSKQDSGLEMEESFQRQRVDSKVKSSGFINLSTFFIIIINFLTWPFSTTEEEKHEAGIYLGRLGKDE